VKRFFLTLFSLSYFLVIYLVNETMSSPSLDISWQPFVGVFLLMGTALLLGYVGHDLDLENEATRCDHN